MRRLLASLTALVVAVLLALALAPTSARVPLARALRSPFVGALLTPPDISLWALPHAQATVALLILLILLTLLTLLTRVSSVPGLTLLYYCAPVALRWWGRTAHEEETPCAD